MAVKLVPKFDKAQIKRALLERQKRIKDTLILNLKRVGEKFVTNARDNADFNDQTGKLRSSIGYVIIDNGIQIAENFKVVKKGPEGIATAKKIIDEAKANFPTGLVLIGVAGMDYAAAVESKGFDVITSSAGIAETSLKAALARLANKLK